MGTGSREDDRQGIIDIYYTSSTDLMMQREGLVIVLSALVGWLV